MRHWRLQALEVLSSMCGGGALGGESASRSSPARASSAGTTIAGHRGPRYTRRPPSSSTTGSSGATVIGVADAPSGHGHQLDDRLEAVGDASHGAEEACA